mmetsp:Transcript_13148/g.43133  ORF Transcript_13148/g.43133 Transcript_13148/m.43133 type:complete len:106 (+) Transcript_13148:971-1288(+)
MPRSGGAALLSSPPPLTPLELACEPPADATHPAAGTVASLPPGPCAGGVMGGAYDAPTSPEGNCRSGLAMAGYIVFAKVVWYAGGGGSSTVGGSPTVAVAAALEA